MRYLIDTVVISEYIRKKPVQRVIAWLDEQDERGLFISLLTIAELRKGYYKLAAGKPNSGQRERAKKISDWIQILERRFQERILPLDTELLDIWARICGSAEAQGRKLPVFDSLLAATAEKYNLIVVTRNITDFKNCADTVELFNPYERVTEYP